ncbi:hypothetical protein ACNPNP_01400 [Microbacterium sp. AGC85]
MYRRLLRARREAPHDTDEPSHQKRDPFEEQDAAILQAVIDGLSLQLADMDPDEAVDVGAQLLDHYLATQYT